jgi:hypothetical protein
MTVNGETISYFDFQLWTSDRPLLLMNTRLNIYVYFQKNMSSSGVTINDSPSFLFGIVLSRNNIFIRTCTIYKSITFQNIFLFTFSKWIKYIIYLYSVNYLCNITITSLIVLVPSRNTLMLEFIIVKRLQMVGISHTNSLRTVQIVLKHSLNN